MKENIKELLESAVREDFLIAIQLLQGKSYKEISKIFDTPFRKGMPFLVDITIKLKEFHHKAFIIAEDCYIYAAESDIRFGGFSMEYILNVSYLYRL